MSQNYEQEEATTPLQQQNQRKQKNNSVGMSSKLSEQRKDRDAKMTLEDSQIMSCVGGRSHCQSIMEDKSILNFRQLMQPSVVSSSICGTQLQEYCEKLGEVDNQSSTESDGHNTREAKPQTQQELKIYEQYNDKSRSSYTSQRKQSTIDKVQKQKDSLNQSKQTALELINEPSIDNAGVAPRLIMNQSPQTDNQRGSSQHHKSLTKLHNAKFVLFGWGQNSMNQLGLHQHAAERLFGTASKTVLIPRELKDIQFEPELIACGKHHTMFVTRNGELYGLGSNQMSALGLSKKYETTYQNEIIQIDLPINSAIDDIQCGDHHTIIQFMDGQLFGCGLNSNGQLGQDLSVEIVKQFTPILLDSAQIDQVSCGPDLSIMLDIHNQRLYELGPSGKLCYDLRDSINDDSIVQIQRGCSCTLLLSESGNIYLKHDEFMLVEQIQQAREIAVCNKNYAILTMDNKVYNWKEGEEFEFKQINDKFERQVFLHSLTVGENFGHVLDTDLNLFGWGDNKFGELGTSDNFPRQKLSQVRIFNNEKMYMRCIKIFTGNDHVIAVFESNKSQNGIYSSIKQSRCNSSMVKTETPKKPLEKLPVRRNQSNQMSKTQEFPSTQKPQLPLPRQESQKGIEIKSLCMSPSEQRRQQYMQTQEAINKYREQAQSYRENVKRIKEQISAETRSHQDQNFQSVVDSGFHSSYKPPKSKSNPPVGSQGTDYNTRQTNIYEESRQNFSFLPSKRDSTVPKEKEKLIMEEIQNRPYFSNAVSQESLVGHNSDFLKFHSNFANAYLDANIKKPPQKVQNVVSCPPTFSSINNNPVESVRTAYSVKLAQNIQTQIQKGNEVLAFSRSQRSSLNKQDKNSKSFSPHRNEKRQKSKHRLHTDYNAYSNINIVNQQQNHNQNNKSVSTSGRYHLKSNKPSSDQDTYELSQSNINVPTRGSQYDLQQVKHPQISNDYSQISSQLISCIPFNDGLNTGYGQSISPTDTLTNQKPSLVVSSRQLPPQIVSNNKRTPHYDPFTPPSGEYSHAPTQKLRQSLPRQQRNDSLNNKDAYVRDTEKQDETHHKLNKYRRKLKKYINKNMDIQKEMQQLKEQAAHFQNQNQRLLRCQQLEEDRVKTHLQIEEQKVVDLQEMIDRERYEKNQIISNLTQENLKMVNELQDRDQKHTILEQKMNEVHEHVNAVTTSLNQFIEENNQMQQTNDILQQKVNQQQEYILYLESQLEVTRTESISKEESYSMVQQQLDEMIRQMKHKEKALHEREQQINVLRVKRRKYKKTAHDLELTVKDLQNQLLHSHHSSSQHKQKHNFRNSQINTIDDVEPAYYDNFEYSKQGKIYSNENTILNARNALNNVHRVPTDEEQFKPINHHPTANLFYQDLDTHSNSQMSKEYISNYKKQLTGEDSYSRTNEPYINEHSKTNSFGHQTKQSNSAFPTQDDLHFQKHQSPMQQQVTHDQYYTYDFRNQASSPINQVPLVQNQQFQQRVTYSVPPQRLHASIMAFSQNPSHHISRNDEMMVIDNFEAQQVANTGLKSARRSKSGPPGAQIIQPEAVNNDYSYRTYHYDQQNMPIYFKDHNKNAFNVLFNPTNSTSRQLAQKSFPNLSYVTSKYFNPDKNQFLDNPKQFISNSGVRPNHIKTEGTFSPQHQTNISNATRRSAEYRYQELPSQIMKNAPSVSSYNNVMGTASTRIQTQQNEVTYKPSVQNHNSRQCVANNPVRESSYASKSPEMRPFQYDKYEDLTNSQKKQAYLMFKDAQVKQSPIPAQIMKDGDDSFVQNNGHIISAFDYKKREVYSAAKPDTAISNDGGSQFAKSHKVVASGSQSAMTCKNGQDPNPLDTSVQSYKDMIMNKMATKVNTIQNILNNKKERLLQKEEAEKKKQQEQLKKQEEEKARLEQEKKKEEKNRPLSHDGLTESTLDQKNLSNIFGSKKNRIMMHSSIGKAVAEKTRDQDASLYKSVDNNKKSTASFISNVFDKRTIDLTNKSNRDRSPTSNNQSQEGKYKEAFRNLSQEIKRKMTQIQKDNEEESLQKNLMTYSKN